jgi:hypothetical protein
MHNCRETVRRQVSMRDKESYILKEDDWNGKERMEIMVVWK